MSQSVFYYFLGCFMWQPLFVSHSRRNLKFMASCFQSCWPHPAWRARWPWGRQTLWGRRPGPWSGWRPPAGGAGPGWCSWFCLACWGKGPAGRATGSCPAAETTGWHREGRARSRPPPVGSPGGAPRTGLSQRLHMEAHLCHNWSILYFTI